MPYELPGVQILGNRTIIEYSGGKATYVGINSQSALLADSTWNIKKFFYSGDDLIDSQNLVGSWNNRVTLPWRSAAGD